VGGGTVTTAGNLVFQVIPDGRFVAYSADKGEKLLDIQTGLRGGMAPPITYMLDGKQYVAFLGGQGIVLPPLPNAPPPAPGAVPGNAASTGGTAPPKLLTFVLDGKSPLPK
jgi:quinohemoprotein ethanol dehydrogenase